MQMRRAVVKQRPASFVHSEPLVEAGMEKGAKSRECAAEHALLVVSFLWRKEKRKKAQISARTAGRALLTMSFLPKTVIVPVFETDSSYP